MCVSNIVLTVLYYQHDAELDRLNVKVEELLGLHNLLPQKTDAEPSARVIAAINELESGGGQRFDTVDALFADLENDDDPMVQIGKDEFDRFVVSDNVLLVYGYGATKRLAIIDYLTALIEYLRIVEQDAVEDKAENALLIESGILPKLIKAALQTEQESDE